MLDHRRRWRSGRPARWAPVQRGGAALNRGSPNRRLGSHTSATSTRRGRRSAVPDLRWALLRRLPRAPARSAQVAVLRALAVTAAASAARPVRTVGAQVDQAQAAGAAQWAQAGPGQLAAERRRHLQKMGVARPTRPRTPRSRAAKADASARLCACRRPCETAKPPSGGTCPASAAGQRVAYEIAVPEPTISAPRCTASTSVRRRHRPP